MDSNSVSKRDLYGEDMTQEEIFKAIYGYGRGDAVTYTGTVAVIEDDGSTKPYTETVSGTVMVLPFDSDVEEFRGGIKGDEVVVIRQQDDSLLVSTADRFTFSPEGLVETVHVPIEDEENPYVRKSSDMLPSTALDKYNAVMNKPAAQEAFHKLDRMATSGALDEFHASMRIINPAIDAAMEMCGDEWYKHSIEKVYSNIVRCETWDGTSVIWTVNVTRAVAEWLAYFRNV